MSPARLPRESALGGRVSRPVPPQPSPSPAQSPAPSKEGSRRSRSKSLSRSRFTGVPAGTTPAPTFAAPTAETTAAAEARATRPCPTATAFCNRANPDPNCCLGVFGLSLYTTERDLREVFFKRGSIADVRILYDQQSTFQRLCFENREDSKEAKERANVMELDGRRIRYGGTGGPSVGCRYSRNYCDRGYDRGYDSYDDRDVTVADPPLRTTVKRLTDRSRSCSRSYSPCHY